MIQVISNKVVRRLMVCIVACFHLPGGYAQAVIDTTDYNLGSKVSVGGYIDAYYGYDFNEPVSGDRPYFVSSARHNEVTLNLAYIDLKYSSSRLRAHFVPGFGTYMNANYAAEPGVLKNIVEGNMGVKLLATKNIWLDVGVLSSPYTNESAISKDHLMYTRSFAPEYVPYYLSGVKLSVPLGSRTTFYFYFLNGWQQIQDQNKGKSIGTQLSYRPNDFWLINWNTYAGDERSDSSPDYRTRYFSDIYFTYAKERLSATGCIYGGIQNVQNNSGTVDSNKWWQANLMGRYRFAKKFSLSGRVEYFSDPNSVQIKPITDARGFSTYSTGLCLDIHIASNIMARLEGRTFFSNQEVYLKDNNPSKTSNLLISNLTIWF